MQCLGGEEFKLEPQRRMHRAMETRHQSKELSEASFGLAQGSIEHLVLLHANLVYLLGVPEFRRRAIDR